MKRTTRTPAPAALPARLDSTDMRDLILLALDPRSPLGFFERLGLTLWLGESSSNGPWL